MNFSTLKSFADTHRLRTSTDDCGEVIIPGRQGQLYEYSKSLLAVMFMPQKPRQGSGVTSKGRQRRLA
jgi:hypothetical protein